jgi:GLPGLI family protein
MPPSPLYLVKFNNSKLMKKAHIAILLSVLLLAEGKTQDLSGTISYQQTIRYNFKNIKEAHENDQRTSSWLASLPEEANAEQLLYFNGNKALFEEDLSKSVVADPRLQRAVMYEGMLSPPRPVVQKVYYDFDKNQKVEQVEYLTRIFLVSSEIEAVPWKLGSEKKKVLEYTCMNATVTMDDQEIVAWFSPEVPISLGPSFFGGLPGLILAVERNGETAYVATSVNLTPPAEVSMQEPDKGSKVSKEEFAAIRVEKEKEWEENKEGNQPNPHR